MEKRPQNLKTTGEGGVSRGSNLNSRDIIIICLAVAVLVLGGAFVYKTLQASKYRALKDELTVEKEELTTEFLTLKDSLGVLKSNYDEINAQLDTSRMQIDELVERIAKTDATNRAQIRRYQKELGTLRSIMKHYVYQIDSLNTLNKKLIADNRKLEKKATAVTRENNELKKTVSDLSSKVETGAIVRGRDVRAVAQEKSGKQTDRFRKVDRIAVYVTLAQNALAECGRMSVYAIVCDPDGNVLTDPALNPTMTWEGSTISVSVCRDNVDYQGEDLTATLYLLNVPKEKFVKGVYTVKVLTDQTVLGESKFFLK